MEPYIKFQSRGMDRERPLTGVINAATTMVIPIPACYWHAFSRLEHFIVSLRAGER